MADKLSILGAVGTYQTIKQLAYGSARTKGAPEVLVNMFVFPFDDYATGKDQLLVYKSQRTQIEASAANTDIASVNIALGDPLYWDASASKITNVAAGNRRIGRALEAKDYSGGVAAAATLLFELEQSPSFRTHCGTGTLDGSNPTPITHGLGTCLSFVAQLIGNTAPGDNTSALTAEISSSVVNVYAWKNTGGTDPTLVASTGTETFYWIAVGL